MLSNADYGSNIGMGGGGGGGGGSGRHGGSAGGGPAGVAGGGGGAEAGWGAVGQSWRAASHGRAAFGAQATQRSG